MLKLKNKTTIAVILLFILPFISCSHKTTEEKIKEMVRQQLILGYPKEVHEQVELLSIVIDSLKGINFFGCHIYSANTLGMPPSPEYYFIENKDNEVIMINDIRKRKFYTEKLAKYMDYDKIDTTGNYLTPIKFIADINYVSGYRQLINTVNEIPGYKKEKDTLNVKVEPLKYIETKDSKTFIFYVWANNFGYIDKYIIEFHKNSIKRDINRIYKGVGKYTEIIM